MVIVLRDQIIARSSEPVGSEQIVYTTLSVRNWDSFLANFTGARFVPAIIESQACEHEVLKHFGPFVATSLFSDFD